MLFHDVEQNTDEWLDLRIGDITGSGIAKIMANYGKAFGDPAKKYAFNLAMEQITAKRSEEGYSNAHMKRGHEQEPIARAAYEDFYFCDVKNGGFFEVGDMGCSPDGLVDDDGLIEIKCVISSVHYEVISRDSYDPKYKWQMAHNLKTTDKEWIDFVSYCSTYVEDKMLYVHRSHKKDFQEEFNMMDMRLCQFRALVEEEKKNILMH